MATTRKTKKKLKASVKTRRKTSLPKKSVPRRLAKIKGPLSIGKITHYFDKIKVGIIKLSAPLSVGATINIVGHGKEFLQKIDSMQLNHRSILKAKKGWEIGIKVDAEVKPGDLVFKGKTLEIPQHQSSAKSPNKSVSSKVTTPPPAAKYYQPMLPQRPERPPFVKPEISPVRSASATAAQIFTPLWAQFSKSMRQKKETPVTTPLETPTTAAAQPEPPATKPNTTKPAVTKPVSYRDVKFLSF